MNKFVIAMNCANQKDRTIYPVYVYKIPYAGSHYGFTKDFDVAETFESIQDAFVFYYAKKDELFNEASDDEENENIMYDMTSVTIQQVSTEVVKYLQEL